MTTPRAILVLGGKLTAAGRPSASLARRCRAAAEAAARWERAPVIACGGRRWGGVVEADAMAHTLAALGVSPARIERERLSLTTVENLIEGSARARVCAPEREIDAPLAIVTCDWHLPRALAIAASLGIAAVGVPAPGARVGALARVMRRAREGLMTRVDARLAARGRGRGRSLP
jgi:uncharacterized SAM-binding protein YcdF (DUF218 family)